MNWLIRHRGQKIDAPYGPAEARQVDGQQPRGAGQPSLDVVRELDARTNISAATEPAAPGDSEPEVYEDYVSAYDLGRFAESARFVRHYPEQNKVLHDLLPSITTPAQIVASANDAFVPWSNDQYLAGLLPNNEIHLLDPGQFAWEEASEE
jgi:pimeloyl-ACP methyl ester carboxylesterase